MTAPASALRAGQFIPIKQRPNAPDDGFDSQRVQLVIERWKSQDALLLQRDRQIEENVRMLLGRQWEVFSPQAGRFIDITQFMSDEERAFRQRPVVNRLLYWFILTHARLTESSPVITFQPSTADQKDAVLAEVMDPIFKTLWHETGMLEVIDRLMAWMIPCGSAFLKSRVDFAKGAMATVPSIAGYDENGVAQIENVQAREGQIEVDVLSPLEVRGEWNNRPWHQKRWHIHLSHLTPGEVKHRWGIEAQPDASGAGSAGASTYLTRLLFGAGHYGAANGGTDAGSQFGSGTGRTEDGYVAVYEMSELPDDNSPLTDDSPGGRQLIVTHNKVLSDSVRPFRCKAASTLRQFTFINAPGRPSGTSPQEMLNPVQRAYNRGFAQLLEHRALMTNPIIELDAQSGIDPDTFVSRPGRVVAVTKRPGVDAIRMLQMPQLSNDVWKIQQVLAETLDVLGNVHGGQGSAPTSDASGSLVEQLRFNSDRFIGPTAKRTVNELARMGDDWTAILPVIWTAEKIIAYAGEDNLPRTVRVLPTMWEGAVNVIPDLESMLPEGRGERQAKVKELYEMGTLGGLPGDPRAVKNFLELSRFPHLSRTIRPGGTQRILADWLLGRMLQGAQAGELPHADWFDYQMQRDVLEEFMSTTDFFALDPALQNQIITRRLEVVQELALQQEHAAELMALNAPPLPPGAAPNGGKSDATNSLPPTAPDAPPPVAPGPAA